MNNSDDTTTSVPCPGLEWRAWTSRNDVPLDSVLLVEVEGGEYHTATFKLAGNRKPVGFVGGRFHFDYKILRWASIQHLLPG